MLYRWLHDCLLCLVVWTTYMTVYMTPLLVVIPNTQVILLSDCNTVVGTDICLISRSLWYTTMVRFWIRTWYYFICNTTTEHSDTSDTFLVGVPIPKTLKRGPISRRTLISWIFRVMYDYFMFLVIIYYLIYFSSNPPFTRGICRTVRALQAVAIQVCVYCIR